MARSEGTNIIYIRFLLSRAQSVQFSSVQLLCRVRLCDAMNRSMPGCPSPTPGVHSNSGPSSRWYHPTVSSSTDHFSSSLKSFPASESFQMSQLFRQVARVLEFQSIVTWPQLNIWGLGCSLPAGKPRRKRIWKTKGIADAVDLFIVLLFLHKAERASFHSIADNFLNKVGPTRLLFLRLCCLEWPDQVGPCLWECCPLSPAQFWLSVLHLTLFHTPDKCFMDVSWRAQGVGNHWILLEVQSTREAFFAHIQNSNQLVHCWLFNLSPKARALQPDGWPVRWAAHSHLNFR